MRHIPLASQTPDSKLATKAEKLLEKLKAAPDASARRKIIDDNSAFWGKYKKWLLSLSYEKCWFSEAKDCFTYWEVEHFRPKKSIREGDGTDIEGYWWLAFDWRNMRICGKVGNVAKSTYFPLRPGCHRASPIKDLRFEDPELLDPADEDDPLLLSFNLEGMAIPAAHVKDPWDQQRIATSIKRYNLNFAALSDKRRAVWAECWQRIQQYRDELQRYQAERDNLIARESLRQASRALLKLMRPDQEFSTVARACISASGDPRVIALLEKS